MALPKDMRLKGHRTFNYIHKNSTIYYGNLMTFKVARSNPEILLTHKLTNTSNKFDFCNDKSRLLEEFQNLMFKSRLIK